MPVLRIGHYLPVSKRCRQLFCGTGMKRVYIGTSGWVYKEWQKHFYPEDVPAKRQFEFYATQFPTVEINATFYRLPTLKMVRGWRDKAPPGFVFAVKGSRFITHILKISGASKGLRKYFSRLKGLEKRTGPVLWQLPPFLKKSPERLERFLKILPKNYCHAVEFRHPSWYEGKEVFALLRKYKAAHVNLSSLKMPMNLTVTADFVYIRFHGLEGGAYHDYTRAELEPWAAFICKQARAGRNVYAYFNNDLNVHAPDNAKALMEMIGGAAVKSL
jgi:uncharacterized protein YecE (DUF72 family)